MNDYEQERLANIAKNEALLKEIGLTGIKPPKPKQSTPVKRVTPKKREPAEPVARRTSSRLSGIPADSEVAKRKAEAESDARWEQERRKRQRVPGPLDLKDVVESGAWKDAQALLSKITADPIKREYLIEITKTEDNHLAELRESMSSLRLHTTWDPSQIKITPERVFSIAMHPGDKKLVIAGDKAGYLGVWDVDGAKSSTIKIEDEDEEKNVLPSIHHYKLHSRTITSMGFDPDTASKLYTSSYDGSIRCLDLPTGSSAETFASTSDSAITCLDVHPNGHQVYFSTLDGEIGLKDVREKASECQLYQLHDRKVGSLSLWPTQPHIVATASLDRTMKLWDFRQMTGPKKERRPTLKAEYQCDLSVSSAFFNSRGTVLATSYDDTLKLFDLSGIETWPGGIASQIVPDVSVRHNNQTGRWLTIFKAAWQQSPRDGHQKFVVGNMKRKIDLFDHEGRPLTTLENEYITAVPAVVAFHPSHNWLIAGNASGKGLFFA